MSTKQLIMFQVVAVALFGAFHSVASPMVAPGDVALRDDLQLLVDARVVALPISTWPIPWADIANSIQDVDESSLDGSELDALRRVKSGYVREMNSNSRDVALELSVARRPLDIRSFANTPRYDSSLAGGGSWRNGMISGQIRLAIVANATDRDSVTPDGSGVTAELGNWLISAGWHDRWWGPGHDGSLILSNNARPAPAIAIQRMISTPFRSRSLSWLGPWSLTAHIARLNDDRVIGGALFFGIRGVVRPAAGLELGISRTAQWCGNGRPCGASTFVDLLLGRDNRGVNVVSSDEPGNQLAGVDARWVPVRKLPIAIYMQWIGEDTRRGGPELGSWLRLAGLESWGGSNQLSHRIHFEVADTACHDGGLGFSEIEPDCAYEHSTYQSGYRFNGRSIGHTIDSDGLSYSLGSTLVQSAGHNWRFLARYTRLNRVGSQTKAHSLTSEPRNVLEIQGAYTRRIRLGQIELGLGVRVSEVVDGARAPAESSGFVRWRSGTSQ